jgi:hypothetical protein
MTLLDESDEIESVRMAEYRVHGEMQLEIQVLH